MQILISGSLAFDRIMDFPERFSDYILPDKIHILNVCFVVNGVKERFGGTAGNIAYNLALLGERPLVLSCVGRDFGDYEHWMKSLGLPLDGIRRIHDELTASAYITTDKQDNQITGFNPGAMRYPCEYDLNGIDPEHALAIIAPGNPHDMVHYCRTYKEKGIPYICDPGQQIPVLNKKDLLEMITGSLMLVSNDYELEMIVRVTGVEKSGLLEKTESVITTLGEGGGALVTTSEQEVAIPAVKVDHVADPTGAGDAFRAGLIKGLVMEKTVEEAARMGAVCASFNVQCQGTQCHRFTWEQFWERYEANFGLGSS